VDFEKVLKLLIRDFEKENINYAIIGGFAVGALGIMRATMDLDFLVDAKDIPKLAKIMGKYNYRCVFKTENVSQYVSGIKIFGEVYFLHAFRKISLSMLKRAKEIPIFGEKFKIKVLEPEDIIGLKLQALVNDSSKETKEYADIEALMDYFKDKLNWDLIKEYFSLFEKENKFVELRQKYKNVK
jgi:predicted nucleotidyltransferase